MTQRWQSAQSAMIEKIRETLTHVHPSEYPKLMDPSDPRYDPNSLCRWVNSYHPRPGGGDWNYETITRAARKLREIMRGQA